MGRRTAGTGSIKELPGGGWKGRLPLGKGRDGKPRYRYQTFPTKKAVDAWLAEMRGVRSRATTFEQYAKHWLAVKQAETRDGELAVATFTAYKSTVERHLIPRLGVFDLTVIRPTHIERALRYHKDPYDTDVVGMGAALNNGTRYRPIGRASIQKFRALLHAIFQRAVRDELIVSNPVVAATKTKSHTQHASKQTGLEPEELRALIDASRGTSAEPYIVLGLATGARPSELLALRWADIDFEGATVRIDASLGRLKVGGPLVRKATKTRSSRRTLNVPPDALAPLHDRIGKPDEFVFATSTGAPRDVRNFAQRAFAPVARLAGLPHITLYTLRHAHATALLRANVSIIVAAARLGHSSTKLLENVYAHATHDLQLDASNKLANLFSSPKDVRP